MQISNYGVILRSMREADLEMVRIWRNSEFTRPYMSYQSEITPEMQTKWFKELSPSNNLYFIISINDTDIGVINLKNIDQQAKTAEAGIFIGHVDYMNTVIPVPATITLMQFAFEILELSYLRAKIKTDNDKVITFNKNIGYQKEGNQSDGNFHYYSVNSAQFYEATAALRVTLQKMNAAGLQVIFDDPEKL